MTWQGSQQGERVFTMVATDLEHPALFLVAVVVVGLERDPTVVRTGETGLAEHVDTDFHHNDVRPCLAKN